MLPSISKSFLRSHWDLEYRAYLLVPSREWLEFEGGVISALFQRRIGVIAPMEITP